MRRLAALPLALLIAAPTLPAATFAAEPEMPAHIVAETFCVAMIVGDMTMISDHLTSELYKAIGQALLKNDEIQKQHPDEKPPLGDGVPWASYQDAVSDCAVDYDAAKNTPATIPITYSFPDAPDAGWTDTLVLKVVDGEWQLEDVRYEDGGSLAEALVTLFENA